MENLSNQSTRARLQAERADKQARQVQQRDHSYTYEGQSITVIDTFSRRGKRIALVEDREGDQFEVFMEQLE